MNTKVDGSFDTESNPAKALVESFGSTTGKPHNQIRSDLCEMGKQVLPVLIQALANPKAHIRWEAAKALGEIGDPAAAPALISCLEDEDIGVRWTAMESLIAMKRGSVKPLLDALTRRFGSVWVREGAHHILHDLHSRGLLTTKESLVLAALEEAVPDMRVPWAARAALDELEY